MGALAKRAEVLGVARAIILESVDKCLNLFTNEMYKSKENHTRRSIKL